MDRNESHFIEGNISTFEAWIGTKFGTDIRGFQIMYPNDFGDSLTFPVASLRGLHFWFRVKFLNYHWSDWPNIWQRHSRPHRMNCNW